MSEQRALMRRHWAQLFLAGVTLLALYLGSYYALLDSKVYWPIGVNPPTGQNLFAIEARYRASGEAISELLGPAHRLDRLLRANHWTTIENSTGRVWKSPSSLESSPPLVDASSE